MQRRRIVQLPLPRVTHPWPDAHLTPLSISGSALFAGSAAEFIEMAPASRLTAHLTREFNRRWGTANESEINSWRSSLTALVSVVEETRLDRSGVGVELKLPLTDKRVDVSFVARDAAGDPNVVLVELKQWESAGPSLFPDNVVVMGREMLHPSVQVAAYADYLRDAHSAFSEDGFRLSACAYLHNMKAGSAAAIRHADFAELALQAPLFTRDDRHRLGSFLGHSLSGGDGLALLPNVVSGRYRPSKKLIEGVRKALSDSPVWTLLDEQRIAFNLVRGRVRRAVESGEKAAVIVVGGPGTGKSVIAAHLLVHLGTEGYSAVHATGSKAFTTNLRALGPRPTSARALFRYFNNFLETTTRRDEIDVLIADEAHRIRETSNSRYTGAAKRSSISQARELVRAARVSVFFLDERQNVRPDEIGTPAAIREAAMHEGAVVDEILLTGQFRCGGCSGYIDWVDALMSDAPMPAGPWLAAGEYDLKLFDDPVELEHAIVRQARQGASARIVAGFCWPWSDPRLDGSLVHDVQIGDWARPWNEKPPEQRKPARPQPRPDRSPYALWATQPERVREIGCIYSAQGLEFDYCGVIIGDDLVWREGEGWKPSREASRDPAIARRRLSDDELRRLLQHTYRVLLTRGIKGTYVYSTDPETRELIERLME